MLSEVIHSEHSYAAMHLAVQQPHQRFVHSGPLVLRANSLKNQRLQQIGDQPVSRRSEPSSCSILIGEQPNPWDLLQPQDKSSRHRGAEPCRRYGRLGTTSLLSPGLLLSGNLRRHLTPTIGSLCSAFASVRDLPLTVKLVYAITLSPRFPFAANQP